MNLTVTGQSGIAQERCGHQAFRELAAVVDEDVPGRTVRAARSATPTWRANESGARRGRQCNAIHLNARS